MGSIFIDTLNGKSSSRPPVWFMRQAGRILPSYRALKKNYTFNQLMRDKSLASKVTLLPINDLGVDAAILFSDILIVPESLGLELEFTNLGPKFHNPVNENTDLVIDYTNFDHVYDNIKEVIKNKPKDIPLIGFCGGPLTTFLFMFRGNEKNKSFDAAINFFRKEKKKSMKIMEMLTEASIEYVKNQVKSGIDCFQLFETYSGIISNEDYKNFILPLSTKILLEARESGVPTIFFPKNFNEGLKYINKEMCDYVSVDYDISLDYARNLLDSEVGIQGNMDPKIFYQEIDEIENYLKSLIDFGSKNTDWIFNLGHGFRPDIDHIKVKYVVEWIKNANWKR